MEKVKVAVLGLGSWGECHLEAYRSLPNVEVTAVCDVREEVLNRVSAKYPIARRYTNADEMWERNDIDLVSIVTYENAHLVPTLKALKSGKHVLVEKPVSTSIRETKEMWQTAEACGRLLLPGHLMRFDPQYADLHQSLQDGRIGKPVSLFLKRTRPKSLFATYQRIHTVYELTVHDLDLAIWYAGSRVQKVRAYGRSVTGAKVPDLLWVCLEFQNGVVAIIESSWLTPNEANITLTDGAEIIGDQGIAGFDTGRSGLQIWNGQGRHTPDFNLHASQGGRVIGALREQLGYICGCIQNGSKPDFVSFSDAIHGIEVAEAIIKSSESGEEITIS